MEFLFVILPQYIISTALPILFQDPSSTVLPGAGNGVEKWSFGD
jgi:hypothetical protein